MSFYKHSFVIKCRLRKIYLCFVCVCTTTRFWNQSNSINTDCNNMSGTIFQFAFYHKTPPCWESLWASVTAESIIRVIFSRWVMSSSSSVQLGSTRPFPLDVGVSLNSQTKSLYFISLLQSLVPILHTREIHLEQITPGPRQCGRKVQLSPQLIHIFFISEVC